MGNDNPIHPPAANMKLTTSFLLPLLVGAASAITDASVYIFDAAKRPSTSPPSLSPEQARLVFAQRLGASQYHGIGDASEVTLSYVNRFGGPQESLFQGKTDKVAELVLIVEGVSSETAEPLLKEWSTIEPDLRYLIRHHWLQIKSWCWIYKSSPDMIAKTAHWTTPLTLSMQIAGLGDQRQSILIWLPPRVWLRLTS